MAVPSKKKLLRDVAGMTHNDRTRTLALIGRDNAGTSDLRKLLDSLDGDVYEWRLRLVAAKAAREPADIWLGLQQPDRSVRDSAIHGLEYIDLTSAELAAALRSARPADRRSIGASIRRRGDSAIADELIDEVFASFGAHEAAAWLPACSAETVTSWLPRLEHAVGSWTAIASRHQDVFVSYISSQLGQSPMERDRWWAQAGPGIVVLAKRDPRPALDIWEQFGPPTAIPACIRSVLNRLMNHSPDRTIAQLLAPGLHSQLRWLIPLISRQAAGASDHSLAQFATVLFPDQSAIASLLRRIAPSRREAIFEQATADVDISTLVITQPLLDALPHERRHREARRILALPEFVEDRMSQPGIVGSLPIDECWDELIAQTRASNAQVRGLAYAHLAAAVFRSRDTSYLSRLLDELQRLKNDQDPVRLAASQALREFPVHLITADQFAEITKIVSYAVESRDTSQATLNALTAFVSKVLAVSATPGNPLIEACAQALETLAEHGHIRLGRMYQSLPAGGEFALFEALRPRLVADLKAERYTLLFELVQALGPKAHSVTGLQDMLGVATRASNDATAERAIRLWLDAGPGKSRRVGELIEQDASVVYLSNVFRLVSLLRQDLLDVALASRGVSGRFAMSGSRVVPLVFEGVLRWNSSQWTDYATLLESAIDDEHHIRIRSRAIRTLARIPGAGERLLPALLRRRNVPTIEAALAGTAWGQRPDTRLATLLSYAHSDRARVAIYSATRAARFVEPANLTAPLSELLTSQDARLTSRKEALRILGSTHSPGSLDVLAELWDRRPLHRDITIALASALRNHPDNSLTWQVLGSMAQGSDDEALALVQSAASISTWPVSRRAQLADLVVPLVGHRSRAVSDAMWSSVAGFRPWTTTVSDKVRETIIDLDRRADLGHAISVLNRIVDGLPDDPVFRDSVAGLVAQQEGAERNAGHDRDLPIEQRLELLFDVDPTTAAARGYISEAAAGALAAGYVTAGLRFVMLAIHWELPGTSFDRLAEACRADERGTPALYLLVANALSAQDSQSRWKPTDLLAIAEPYAESDEPAALIAAAIVAVAGARAGWPEQWRSLLRTLRTHPSPWVMAQAKNTHTASELVDR